MEHEFEVLGGMNTNERGKPVWPDYLYVEIPQREAWRLIRLLVSQLEENRDQPCFIQWPGKIKGK